MSLKILVLLNILTLKSGGVCIECQQRLCSVEEKIKRIETMIEKSCQGDEYHDTLTSLNLPSRKKITNLTVTA